MPIIADGSMLFVSFFGVNLFENEDDAAFALKLFLRSDVTLLAANF
jgi:hypothetical protein